MNSFKKKYITFFKKNDGGRKYEKSYTNLWYRLLRYSN